MTLFLTILNIFAAACSILGFVYIAKTKKEKWFRVLSSIVLGVALLLSLYALIIPATWIYRNVGSKVAYYRSPIETKYSNQILIQRGEFSFGGFGPFAIEFTIPYKSLPIVEVINHKGYDEYHVPYVVKRTAHQVVFKRSTVGGFGIPERYEKYRWIARGEPLQSISER